MENIKVRDLKGNLVQATFVFSFICNENQKKYIALNNEDLVFSQDSAYNNLDIFEITREDGNSFYISDIQEEDWPSVEETLKKEILSLE